MFVILRIQPDKKPGNFCKLVAKFSTYESARGAIIQDFSENFDTKNPACFGGHIEIHEIGDK